jgi:L-amino acid N-acyltransferase YncA
VRTVETRLRAWACSFGVLAITVRPVERRDADELLLIHNHYVEHTLVTFDLVPRNLAEELAWIDEHTGGHPAIVAVNDDGVIVGYASLSTFRSRPAYSTTVEDSVYVHPEHIGHGVGRILLDELLTRAAAHGFHAVIARITGHNEASVRLHAACGFEHVGVEREVGRKHRNWLDVVEMQRLV